MGVTRSDLFTPAQNELATICKALAHPARIAILQYLLSCQSCITGTLVEEVGLAQATISQHLRELKSIGIIKGNVEGTSVCYCIDEKRWQELQGLLNGLFDSYTPASECC